MPVEPGSAVRCVWVTHAERLSRRMPRRAGCPIQRSSPRCRRAKRLRCLTSPPMTWALRRTRSGRPAQASQPTTLRKLGQRNGSGSGYTSLPPSVNSFSMINNAGVPSVGTSSTIDLTPATHPLSRCVRAQPSDVTSRSMPCARKRHRKEWGLTSVSRPEIFITCYGRCGRRSAPRTTRIVWLGQRAARTAGSGKRSIRRSTVDQSGGSSSQRGRSAELGGKAFCANSNISFKRSEGE
jgi:hypothetical protein